jgi:arylsulfatase A-like enzyme
MKNMKTTRNVILALVMLLSIGAAAYAQKKVNAKQPNIIWIMADDLGYGDLGCYGQQLTRTPRIDKLAKEGVRFTQCYAGGHMCSPSRAAFFTGKHQGHGQVRGHWPRKGGKPKAKVQKNTVTVAQVLKKAGYATAGYGKLTQFENGMVGHFGFDEFCIGNKWSRAPLGPHYSSELLTHEGIVNVPENVGITVEAIKTKQAGTYMDDLTTQKACDFISRKRDKPFFVCLALWAPHTPYTHPDLAKYEKKDWHQYAKGYVSMVERMDRHVGQVLDALKKAGLAEKTVVFFTSDNGGVNRHGKGGADRENWLDFQRRIRPNGDLRKGKTYHYEGGIRIPMIVRWPGKVKPGTVSSVSWYFPDAFPTLAEIAGVSGSVPKDVDGVSVLPTILGQTQPTLKDRPMYWVCYDHWGFQQTVRKGDWKLIRWTKKGPRRHPLGDVDPWPEEQCRLHELFNLARDPGEEHNLVDKEPGRLNELTSLLNTEAAYRNHPDWPLNERELKTMDRK